VIDSITISHDRVKTRLLTDALDGTLGAGAAAPTLGAAGIGDGRSAFSFDGGDYVTIYTTKLASELNLAKGSVLIWVKMASAAVWADGTERAFVSLRNAAFDGMILEKQTVANRLRFIHLGSGVSDFVDDTSLGATTDWFLMAMTWDQAADQAKCYLNGAQVGATLTTLGAVANPPGSGNTTLGASNTGVSLPHSGFLAHAAVFDKVLSAAELLGVFNSRSHDMRTAVLALDPIAYWMLDDNSGTLATNEVASAEIGYKFHLNLVHENAPGFADAVFSDFTPEDHAEGGYYSARFKIRARLNVLKEIFERGLGRWVEAWGYGLEPEFEGMITEMTYNLPPDRFTISLDPVVNKGLMRADLDGDGDVDRSTLLENTISQERYPISHLVLGGGEVQGNPVADAAVQQYLDLRAFPRPSMVLGGATGDEYMEIFVRGFIWTLSRDVYNQTAVTGTQAMTAEIRDILNDKGEYVASQRRDANTTVVARVLDADRRPWDLIVDMTKLGDAESNRWLPQMTGRRCTNAVGRQFILKQAAPPVIPPTS